MVLVRGQFNKRNVGATIGTVLVLVSLVSLLAFTVVGSSIQHLHVSNRMLNITKARNAAESVVSLGIEKVLSDPDFGTSQDAEETIEYSHGDTEAKLTFDPSRAANLGIPHSFNNLHSDSASEGVKGRVVPNASVHLVGTGTCGGVSRSIEVILHKSRFPYVIASSGRFRSTGGLFVAGIREEADLTAGFQSLDPAELLPGHIASNSNGADALVLGPDTVITGDVQASGAVVLDSGTDVSGEVRPYADKAGIPDFDISSYDPLALGKTDVQDLTASLLDEAVLEGWVRRTGDLMVTRGLKLDGGALYVDGDLTVLGGLSGTGAVFATGSIQIDGGGAFNADNKAALMAEGDITLSGIGKDSSSFQGLVYTEGDLRADQMTLVGTFIANSGDEDGSTMSIDNSNMIYSEEYAVVEFGASTSTQTFDFDLTKGAKLHVGKESKEGSLTLTVSSTESGLFTLENIELKADDDDDDDDDDGLLGDLETFLEANSGPVDAASMIDALSSAVQQFSSESISSKDLAKIEKELAELTIVMPDISAEEGIVTIDPSTFLQLDQQVQILLWKEFQ